MNPVFPMVEAFLAIYSNLPFAVLALIDLSIVLFIVCVVVNILNRVR